ncbi:hypothetical protein C7H83_10290 [Tetragenococcus halophilus]|uniref:Uncharacterized protein n=1 Tax=Tetragenococcus halophilus TaxID=51669 RepID=A0A3G5FKG7_TETHA|nr:hypothetical protein [Tetragenococcus halophilus]AYW50830.1 hypothetical protein C7H83_10290 [Tetragenococcus halophilus]GBD64914.1 hypothetical protein TEHD23766T_2341 [Tetragenococcus halophilus subsp. flandriensis]GMA08894.1 hypothetical protein GCM10025886_20450 [Tetragenococcus halophilus subsp. flandriensis]
MEITITGTPEEIKELFRTDEDSREQLKFKASDLAKATVMGNSEKETIKFSNEPKENKKINS